MKTGLLHEPAVAPAMRAEAAIPTVAIRTVVVTKAFAWPTRSLAPKADAKIRRPTVLMPPKGNVNSDPKAIADSNSP